MIFSCANGTLELPNRPSLSLLVEANSESKDDIEIDEDNKETRKNKRFVIHGGEYNYRYHVSLVWRFTS